MLSLLFFLTSSPLLCRLSQLCDENVQTCIVRTAQYIFIGCKNALCQRHKTFFRMVNIMVSLLNETQVCCELNVRTSRSIHGKPVGLRVSDDFAIYYRMLFNIWITFIAVIVLLVSSVCITCKQTFLAIGESALDLISFPGFLLPLPTLL